MERIATSVGFESKLLIRSSSDPHDFTTCVCLFCTSNWHAALEKLNICKLSTFFVYKQKVNDKFGLAIYLAEM